MTHATRTRCLPHPSPTRSVRRASGSVQTRLSSKWIPVPHGQRHFSANHTYRSLAVGGLQPLTGVLLQRDWMCGIIAEAVGEWKANWERAARRGR